jgi:hypothetical protein
MMDLKGILKLGNNFIFLKEEEPKTNLLKAITDQFWLWLCHLMEDILLVGEQTRIF